MKIHTYADLLMFSSRVIWSVTEMNKSSAKKKISKLQLISTRTDFCEKSIPFTL